jgi:ABC-type branched-subunit amino acid transport system substrate-binding protein
MATLKIWSEAMTSRTSVFQTLKAPVVKLFMVILFLNGCMTTYLPSPEDQTKAHVEDFEKKPAKEVSPPAETPLSEPVDDESFFKLLQTTLGTEAVATPLTASKSTISKHRIALLVPLSGPHSEVGNAFLKAAQIALFDTKSIYLEILPKDTKGTPEGAAQAASSAIKEGAEVIIGPLLSPEVKAVEPIAQAHKIYVLSFSNNIQVANQTCFIMGLIPSQQVNDLAFFAKSQGQEKHLMVASQRPYGIAVSQSYKSALKDQTTDLITYAPQAPLSPEILIGRLQKFQPQVLWLPEAGAETTRLLSYITAQKEAFPALKIFGSDLWDEPSTLEDVSYTGTFLPGAEPRLRKTFYEKYKRLHKTTPPRLALLAYDAIALCAALTQAHPQSPFTLENLIQRQGFRGLNGIFRFLPNGVIERHLAILVIDADGPREVHSPRIFLD